MSDSFGLVENKIFEAEYFLESIEKSRHLSLEASYSFSAFASASRSVTFSLQAVMSGVDGFEDWYEEARKSLSTDQLARYFVEVRNDVVHKGRNPLNQVPLERLRESLSRQLNSRDYCHVLVVSDASRGGRSTLVDAVPACKMFFTSLLSLVFECYYVFRFVVDPRWHFTEESFIANGKTLDDALGELGFPSSWSQSSPSGPGAWKALRKQQPSCLLNPIFRKYLGQVILDPDEEVS
ncbi:MAG: hypothetical protein EPN74_12580 [Rhodanobacter sp.]|nr:MAG: hypothetical protein EPN74_12580 [Rhodanobacter sp.]